MGEALVKAPENSEIERLRQAGRGQLAFQKEVQKLEQQIQGLTWGAGNQVVQGSSLSPMTRRVIAEFCRITRANPLTHLDMLGGKPYLNSNYWVDLINTQDRFHHYEQRDISPSVEMEMRDRAATLLQRAVEIVKADPAQAAKWTSKAYELQDEADEIKGARAMWSPRTTATVVVQTTIYRFINAAPMDAIKRGEITDLAPYIVAVPECNWAGGLGQSMANNRPPKYDPIGDANPAGTARTRSLRRAAVKAFSAWMEGYEQQIHQAEEVIEAEWEEITTEQAATQAQRLQPGDAQAVRTGSGEPQGARAEDAQDLPVEGGQPAEPAAEEKQFDFADALKRLFATLHDAGIPDAHRKRWAKDNKLPESTKHWNEAHYEKAFEILTAPTREMVLAALPLMGQNLEDLSLRVLGKRAPDFLKDWLALQTELDKLAQNQGAQPATPDAAQEGLDL